MSKSDSHDSRHGNAAPQEDQDLDGLSPEARRILADEAEEERKANLPPPEDPGLEATELELKWYKTVADDARYGGRFFGLTSILFGLSFSLFFFLPHIDKYGNLSSGNSSDTLTFGTIPFLICSLFGIWLFRLGAFPNTARKTEIGGYFEISVGKGSYRRLLGYHAIIAPKSLRRFLQEHKYYEGEGFYIEKGGESWVIPTKLGEWKISTKDRFSSASKMLARSSIAFPLLMWPVISYKEAKFSPENLAPSAELFRKIYIALGIISTTAIFLTIIGSIGIPIYQWIRERKT